MRINFNKHRTRLYAVAGGCCSAAIVILLGTSSEVLIDLTTGRCMDRTVLFSRIIVSSSLRETAFSSEVQRFCGHVPVEPNWARERTSWLLLPIPSPHFQFHGAETALRVLTEILDRESQPGDIRQRRVCMVRELLERGDMEKIWSEVEAE